MKKVNKTDKWYLAGIGVTLAFALFFAISYSAVAEFSFKDLVAKYTGDSLAVILAQDIDLSGDEIMLGAFPGPDMYNHVNMHAGFQSGGDRYATSSTAATYTLVTAEFDKDKTYIDWTPNVNTTLTTMATTSMGFMDIKNVGDERSYWLRNASTTAEATITFAAGTGVDIQHGDATGDDLIIDGLDLAKLTFIRKADTDVLLIMTKYTEGD